MGRLHGRNGPRTQNALNWDKERDRVQQQSQKADCNNIKGSKIDVDDFTPDASEVGMPDKSSSTCVGHDTHQTADRDVNCEDIDVDKVDVSKHKFEMLNEDASTCVGDQAHQAAADADQWQSQFAGWASWSEHAALHAELVADDSPPLLGDETLSGPDGEVYEIFYPPDCIHDDPLEEDVGSTAAGETASDYDANSSDVGSGDGACTSSNTTESQACRQTVAEIGMDAMVTFMAHSAVARYPARAKLFQTVQSAASFVLRQHFQRFTLVGSTALRIDTPESDLDAVVFTKSCCNASGVEIPAPLPVQTLRRIAQSLKIYDRSLKLQLVECTRVPVLTVLTADCFLSLDLTVNQSLGEYHVLWFQRQHLDPAQSPALWYSVPSPSPDGWSQGLEVAALRCVKWWLRRRRIPVPKEGGYPSIVWTLMVLHVLRCSVFVDKAEEGVNRGRRLLSAIAAFFDRFAESGLVGTFSFTGCAGAEFHPKADGDGQQESQRANLSVLDPTTTNEDSAASGVVPSDLAPWTSAATHLLYSYELRRAQRLSATALAAVEVEENPNQSASDSNGGAALLDLFSDIGKPLNTLAAKTPSTQDGVVALRDNRLIVGVLHQVMPKPGWQAPFLHRQDALGGFALRRAVVDENGNVTQLDPAGSAEWFHPSDFVCMVPFGRNAHGNLKLDSEGLQRWRGMQALLPERAPAMSQRRGGKGRHRKRHLRVAN